MIQIEESNPSFESCNKCIYSDDSEETCILRRCIHAVAQLEECYVPKQPTIEPERKKGKWIDGKIQRLDGTFYWFRECSECGYARNDCDLDMDTNYCPNCGADMREDGEADENGV